jgi:TniQ
VTGLVLFSEAPHQGESLRGYLLRVCEANFLQSTGWLADLPVEKKRIKEAIGITLFGNIPPWLQEKKQGVRASPASINQNQIPCQGARCCPVCFNEMRFWPFEWEHALYTVCHRHGGRLVDQCPSCLSPLSWSRPQLTRCKCGSLISDWPLGARATKGAQALSGQLARCIARETGRKVASEDRYFDGLLDQLDTNQLATLVSVFGTYGETSDELIRSGIHIIGSTDDAYSLMRVTAKLMRQWPSHFHKFLRDTGGYGLPDAIRHEPPRHFSLFTKALRTEFKSPELRFVPDAYQEFITKNWHGILNRRHKWATSKDIQTQRYMSRAQVAISLRIRPEKVKELLERKILRGYVKRTANDRRYYMVERSSLINVEKYCGDHITFSGATALLGLPDGRVNELIAANILTETFNLTLFYKSRMFSRAEIATFLKKLSEGARESSEDELWIRAGTILKTHLASTSEFTSLVQDTLSGRISTICSQPPKSGFRDLIYGRAEFYLWRKSLRTGGDNRLTIVEAAARLSIKQEVAYHLVHSGILPSADAHVGKKKCRLVSLADIEKFKNTYISSANLALSAGTSSKAFVERLRMRGIRPITGPDLDRCRQYFFRREDVSPC